MELGGLSWTDVETEDKVGVLPVGSTEQHGPHAPLSTDSLIARSLSREACKRTDDLCLPSLNIGVSEEHRGFEGTLYVSPSTFRKFVSETVLSASEHGLDRFVVVNGHGGNIDALNEVCAALHRSHGLSATNWTWWKAIDLEELGIEEQMGHAGALETSFVMYLRPELVKDEREKGSDSWGRYVSGAPVAYDSDEFTEEGVVGDPTKASPEKGEKLFEASVNELVSLLDWIRENELGD